jgi:hypothetical protein
LIETFLLVAEAARQGRQVKQLDHRLQAAFTSAASKFRPLADQLQVRVPDAGLSRKKAVLRIHDILVWIRIWIRASD